MPRLSKDVQTFPTRTEVEKAAAWLDAKEPALAFSQARPQRPASRKPSKSQVATSRSRNTFARSRLCAF